MKFNPYIIKRKKQANGLWGMPMNVTSLNMNRLLSDEDSLKFSGIVNSIVQLHGAECRIAIKELDSTDYIQFDVFSSGIWGKDSKIFINLDEYGIIENKLYYIKMEEARTAFYRTAKIKKLSER